MFVRLTGKSCSFVKCIKSACKNIQRVQENPDEELDDIKRNQV